MWKYNGIYFPRLRVSDALMHYFKIICRRAEKNRLFGDPEIQFIYCHCNNKPRYVAAMPSCAAGLGLSVMAHQHHDSWSHYQRRICTLCTKRWGATCISAYRLTCTATLRRCPCAHGGSAEPERVRTQQHSSSVACSPMCSWPVVHRRTDHPLGRRTESGPRSAQLQKPPGEV